MDTRIKENGLHFWLHVDQEMGCRLFSLGRERTAPPAMPDWFAPVQVQLNGMGVSSHHGSKHTGCQPGKQLTFEELRRKRNAHGLKLELVQVCAVCRVISHYQFYDGIPVVRSWSEIILTAEAETLEYLSSFMLNGALPAGKAARDSRAQLYLPHNAWYGEGQWRKTTLMEQGYYPVKERDGYDAPDTGSMKRVHIGSTGTWCSSEYLPMGALLEPSGQSGYVWQIETAAAWHWEIADSGGEMYFQLSGPSYQEHGWQHGMKAGDVFVSVPCAVAYVEEGGFERGIQALTRYRRQILAQSEPKKEPMVIFNDYMNCLWGEPTTEKVLPLVDRAAEIGCGCYCVDAGWYADGPWWDEVGLWEPSAKRFPGGIEEVTAHIRQRGMLPGLWLEPEVIGVKSPVAAALPDHCFFRRHGRRVIDNGRYQLDFSHPDTLRFIDGVVERLVKKYGARYLKIDYNINAGPGTDQGADSCADGLLRHTRAYLQWLEGLGEKYPDLYLENCSSGGMRMEYSLLSRQDVQSVSDQTDALKMAVIACNAPAAVLPEQAAIWSYPMRDAGAESVCLNMVNALLLRIHQSGHLAQMPSALLRLMQEGIALHLALAPRLRRGVPFWPLGLAAFDSDRACLGMDMGNERLLAVWRLRGDGAMSIPVDDASAWQAELLYPGSLPRIWAWLADGLHVEMQSQTASVFRLTKNHK